MQEATHRAHDVKIKWLTLIAVACGGIYAFWQYADVVEKDFRKPFWEKQLHYYFQASDAVSILATTCDESDRETAKRQFYKLYYGPLAIVEDKQVEGAMVRFHNELSKPDGTINCGSKELKKLSLELAWTLRQSIKDTWHVELEDLDRKRNEINK